jgi:hypothetical protein
VALMRPPEPPPGLTGAESAARVGWPRQLRQDWLQPPHRHRRHSASGGADGSGGAALAPLLPSPAAAVALRAAYPSAFWGVSAAASGAIVSGSGGAGASQSLALLCVRTGAERAVEVIVRRGPARRRQPLPFSSSSSRASGRGGSGSPGSLAEDSSELAALLARRGALSSAEIARAQQLMAPGGNQEATAAPRAELRRSSGVARGVWEVNVDEVRRGRLWEDIHLPTSSLVFCVSFFEVSGCRFLLLTERCLI